MQSVCRQAVYYNQLHAGRAAKDIPRLLRYPKVQSHSHNLRMTLIVLVISTNNA